MKPKVGDTVTLKAVEVIDVEYGANYRPAIKIKLGSEMLFVPLDAIASIEPRPLKVGDMVKGDHIDGDAVVVAIDGRSEDRRVWVTSGLADRIVWERDLTRIGDA